MTIEIKITGLDANDALRKLLSLTTPWPNHERHAVSAGVTPPLPPDDPGAAATTNTPPQ